MLKGKTITLRNIQSKDLEQLIELWGDLSVRGEFFPLAIINETTIKQRFAENGFWGESGGHMLIIDPQGEISGAIFFFSPNPYISYIEVGYILFKQEDRGKGYTSEALSLFTDFLFYTKQIPKILLSIDPDNTGSRKVAENNGYVLEGQDKKAYYQNGEYLDVDRFARYRA